MWRYKSFALIAAFLAVVALPATAAAPAPSTQTLLGALKWRSVGPGIGGRVVAIDAVPGSPDTFYFGGVDGGVWRSTDYGLIWTNITDGKLNGSNSIGAIAVAPSDPKIIYVGTGESDIRGTFITGNGVYKSSDAGETWRYAGLGDTHTIGKIVVDPHNPNVLYAASMGHVFTGNPERGVFKSTDGGAHWSKVLFVNDQTGAIDLVMDPHDSRVLYASMWQAKRTPWSLVSGGPGSGLYKSTDGGAHWTNLSKTPGYAKGTLGRIGVTVSPSNPKVVYSIVQAKEGGIFRSSDGGASWTRVNDHMELRQRAFYYMAIYADPVDVNTVYVPQVEACWVSRNGGKSFTRLRTPHGDNHIVWVDPRNPKILLEGNDGGATVSTDGGKTWSTEHNQATGQFYHVALDDQFPFHIYGAQQDEGSFQGPSASAGGIIQTSDWKRTAYGESTFIAPEPGNSNVAYGSGYFSIMVRYNAAIDEYQSVSPWPLYREGAASDELEYRFGWTHPIIFSPANPKQLLVGSQYVLRSDDQGQTWKKISPDLTRNDPKTEAPSGGPIDLDHSSAEVFPDVSALAVSPLDGDVIWAGSADGLVHVTTDGGSNWSLVTPPALPQWCEITSIEASHTDKGTAFLSASRYMWDDFHPYVYETLDYGKHWTPVSSGIPQDQYVFTVRQDPGDPDLVFATTKSTVYVSFNDAANWQPLTLNLPDVQVRDIAIDAREGEVVVATHGRSFWVLDNLALLEQLTQTSLQQGSSPTHLFAPQRAWLTHAYGASAYGGGTAAGNGQNPPFGATVFFYVPRSYDGKTPVSLTFRDASGTVVRTFALHRKPLSGKRPETDERFQPTQEAAQAYARLTGIAPGMNSFQWDLRYADATEVTGFEPPLAAGGLDDTVEGPQVVPGTYTVSLDYGGATTTQSFQVALDPRIDQPADALTARLDLGLKIHAALDKLNRATNEAIAAREQLREAVRSGNLSAAKAQPAFAQLDRAIGNVVQLDIHSSEGTLLHEAKLRSYLAYLAAEVDMAYVKPTSAQYAVFDKLSGDAITGEGQLKSATAEAKALL